MKRLFDLSIFPRVLRVKSLADLSIFPRVLGVEGSYVEKKTFQDIKEENVPRHLAHACETG